MQPSTITLRFTLHRTSAAEAQLVAMLEIQEGEQIRFIGIDEDEAISIAKTIDNFKYNDFVAKMAPFDPPNEFLVVRCTNPFKPSTTALNRNLSITLRLFYEVMDGDGLTFGRVDIRFAEVCHEVQLDPEAAEVLSEMFAVDHYHAIKHEAGQFLDTVDVFTMEFRA